uniref:Uncharacterized protein n=1 Tax=Rhizophora mucronata TaxID=61149 RepID=A0A2P2M8J0_RHIMU
MNMDQHEVRERDVYGSDIPDEGEMDAEEEEVEEEEEYEVQHDPNAKVSSRSLSYCLC